MDTLDQIKEKLFAVEEQLKAENPDIVSDLRFIHTALRKDPENVTLLSDPMKAILVSGLKRQTGEFLAAKEVKSRKPKKKVTIDDLI